MTKASQEQEPAGPVIALDYDAVVIGAGFAGMYMLHQLRRHGFTAHGFETGTDVGGTWYWNRYPGARCDVESLAYSYSFDEDLMQEWDWTERYATQPEILRYAEHVADRFDLRRDITFGTRVASAVFDEANGSWLITCDGGEQFRSRYCITAVGCLSAGRVPQWPGLERFRGQRLHTGAWPHEPVDFSGKRVAVIGTGSSGIQVIPRIAAQAAALTVFQRTANYSLPARNRPLGEQEQKDVKAHYPEIRRRAALSAAGVDIPYGRYATTEVSPEQIQQELELRWQQGGNLFLTTFTDLLRDLDANAHAAEFVRTKIAQTVKDPAVAELLSPRDHPIGSKRICVDTDYFETFNQDHVTLVDARAHPIVEITETSIRTDAGEYEVDALVFATGYDAMTGPLTRIDLRGRGGQTITEKWHAGPLTYLGLATSGFPNLFIITGPGSPSVLANVIASIEQHVDWITDLLEFMRAGDLHTAEAETDAENRWVQHVNEVSTYTLYPHANSWYLGANIPGKPRVFMPYAGGLGAYRAKCDEVAKADYPGFILS